MTDMLYEAVKLGPLATLARTKFEEAKHPRGMGGKFRETPDAPKAPAAPNVPAPEPAPKIGGKLGKAIDEGLYAPTTPKSDLREGFREPTEAERKALKIPPSWGQVQINGDPEAPLQALGIDQKGRVQYRYSAAHTEAASQAKFERVSALAKVMPTLRKNLDKGIDDDEEATILSLILATGMRMGGDKVRGDVPAYGASNLRKKHITMKGNKAHLDFIGKHGVHIEQDVELEPKLARAIKKRLAEAPNDESPIFASTPQKIRAKLAEATGGHFKVHDLRTYTATALALEEVLKLDLPKDKKQAAKQKKQVATVVSSKLGNTPQMAMNSYISPQVWSNWDAWVEGIAELDGVTQKR